MGIELLDVVLPLPPYNIFTINKDTGEQEETGLAPTLMKQLQKTLNFTLSHMEPPDMVWGRKLKNGKDKMSLTY